MTRDVTIPLAIGVTGHRDLRPEDVEPLRAEVHKLFSSLFTGVLKNKEAPHTPLLVLSPLADGADRLVARIALELGARLIVALPFPREEYEKDFDTTSRKEFGDLLHQAHRVVVVDPVLSATGDPFPSISPGDEQIRAIQYEAVGAWVACNCQILIALWDGNRSGKIGGTSTVVDFKLERRRSPVLPRPNALHGLECGPVYHVPTRRSTTDEPLNATKARYLYPPSWGPEAQAKAIWNDTLIRIVRFNQTAKRCGAQIDTNLTQSRDWGPLAADGKQLFARYAAADALALHFQRYRRRALRAVFSVTLLAILTLVAYDDLFSTQPWAQTLAVLSTALFAAAYSTFIFSRRKGFEDNHLTYRALAESLRVQMQWFDAGIDECVSDHYLHKQRTDLDWIRAALRNCRNTAISSTGSRARPPIAAAEAGIRHTLDSWIRNQARYFDRKCENDRARLALHNRFASATARCAAAIGLVLAFFHQVIVPHPQLQNALIAAMGALLAVAGITKGHAETMAYAEEAKQYGRMAAQFRRADAAVTQALEDGDIADAQECIRELGREALYESGDWLLLHRARPMEAPTH